MTYTLPFDEVLALAAAALVQRQGIAPQQYKAVTEIECRPGGAPQVTQVTFSFGDDSEETQPEDYLEPNGE